LTDLRGSRVPFGIKLLGVPIENRLMLELDEDVPFCLGTSVDKVMLMLDDRSLEESFDSQSEREDLCKVLFKDIRGIREMLKFFSFDAAVFIFK
jgi:hypothetical protein